LGEVAIAVNGRADSKHRRGIGRGDTDRRHALAIVRFVAPETPL